MKPDMIEWACIEQETRVWYKAHLNLKETLRGIVGHLAEETQKMR